MNYLARAATAAVVIAFVKLFLGRRRRNRSSDHSNDDTSSPQSDSTPDSLDFDSVPLPIGEYEVFLSFRGPDTRSSITNILYRFLTRSKIRTFRDDDELRKGEGIWFNLVKAIGQSKISVTIFSPRYAESKWCLKELAEIVEHKKEVDVADVVSGVVWSHLSKNNNKLETDELVGIDDQVKQVVDMLDLDSQGVKVVGLHGMGGIGKSTLATAVYNKVSACFDRSMLNIGDDSKFLMHDQLRDMGREIVRREDIERPWMRSRIWLKEEAHELLLNNKGTSQIKSIRLDSASDLLPFWSSCFTDMSELRYFAAKRSTTLIGNFNQVLPNLKWMELRYPSFFYEANYPSLPTLNVKNLIILIVSYPGDEITNNIKEANKLKVLILSHFPYGFGLIRLPEFPESGSLEILEIQGFMNRKEDLKIEKLQNLKVLKLECQIGKIKGGTIGTMMKGLRELHLPDIDCDYDTFRQTIVDIEELSLLQILNVQSYNLEDVLEGIKLPKSLKKLHTSSGFANLEELLDLDEFTIKGSIATTKLAIPPAASSRGGDTSSTIIPWIHSSKLKEMKLELMKRITMVQSKEDTMLPSSLTKLTIYRVRSEQIPNLKNLRNLTRLKIKECPNFEEVQGMGGLKSLQFLQIDEAEKLTHIHGLGNLMSCSNCKLTELYICGCPLLREVVTFEQQDDDDDDGGGCEGEKERYVLVQIESLVTVVIIKSPSIDCRSIPRLSKFPMLKELKIGLNINEDCASKQGQHQLLEGLENLQELVNLFISNLYLERILNLKNLGKLIYLELRECRNLEEVQGMEVLKSLSILRIVGAKKLTHIHGLGNLMSCSSCKLTTLEIRECPLLCEVGTFEHQDDDDDDGGSEGDDVNNDDDVLVKMKISSIDGRSTTPRLSKLPMVKYMKINELRMVLKGTENTEDLSERKLLYCFISKLPQRLIYLALEDVPALLEEIVGAGDMKELCLIMNDCLSLERLHIKDLPYSSMRRIEVDDRLYLSFMNIDFDLSSLATEGGDHLGKLRLNISWPHEELSDAESKGEADSDIESKETDVDE
ncbi:Disease resistance protein L6 [Linum perenne]